MTTDILIVEDEPDAAQLLSHALATPDRAVRTAPDFPGAIQALEDGEVDVVVSDLQLGRGSGLDLCRHMVNARPDVPVVLVTGHPSLGIAVDAIRAGAFDFLTKPMQLDELRHRVRRAIAHRQLLLEVKRLRRRTYETEPGEVKIIGESPVMQRLDAMVNRLADGESTVLITGESGVGKELVARALHARGPRARGPFVAVNCAAVPATLIESELFGHVRGAFTDARRDHEGLFVRAEGGTLLLDEIGELPIDMQAKLLRAIQERSVIPVGGTHEIPFDARIVSATNLDLEEEVRKRRFREDLFYRINVVNIHVPPLRARGSDILLLGQYFLSSAAARSNRAVKGFAPEAAEKMLAYDWPGNVRELENAMERAVALAELEDVRVEDLPSTVRANELDTMVVAGSDPSELPTLAQMGDRYMRRVLQLVGGNKTRAARILGMGRRTLYRRLERLENLGSVGLGPAEAALSTDNPGGEPGK